MILWALYIALIIAGMFISSSKIYDCAVIAFMPLLAWINTDSADYYDIYYLTYQHPTLIPDMDPGWVVLCQIGSALGLSYNGFALVVTLIAMIGIRYFIGKETTNTSYCLALFLVYPGLMSLIQFRQFAASTVIAIAIYFLSKKSRRGTIIFVSLILLAFTMHRSALLAMALLIIPIFETAGKRARIVIGIIIFGIVVFGIFNAANIGNSLFGEYKTSAYLHTIGEDQGNISGEATYIGGLRNCVALILMAIVVPMCVKLIESRKTAISDPDDAFLKIAKYASVGLLALIPFVIITNDFMRIQRYFFIPFLAVFSNMPLLRERHMLLSCKAFYLLICFLFCYEFVVKGTFDSIFIPLLSFEYFPSILA